MSVAAQEAGFNIKWVFDKDVNAVASYRANFHSDFAYQMSAINIVQEPMLAPDSMEVDVLHLSPPIQLTSPAVADSTRAKETGERLQAIGQILDRAKPKMVTFEAVPRFLLDKHYFGSIVRSLTSRGYDVSWKIISCANFGLPQTREGLFIVASR